MKKAIGRMAMMVVLCLGLVNLVVAGEKAQGKGKAAKDMKAMSQKEQIKLVLRRGASIYHEKRRGQTADCRP